jgi:HSP20 family molecular chaperone IbpA
MHVTGKKEIFGEKLEVDRKLVLPAGSLNSGEPITAKVENGLLFINLKNSQKTKQTVVDIS